MITFQPIQHMKIMKFTLIGILLLLSNIGFAQDNDRFSRIEEMHARKWQSLLSQAQLTPKEIDVVKPVFMEYEQSVWKLHQANREFFKSAMKNANQVKPNFADLNDRYVDFEFKQAQMFKCYHMQLRKLLQPETLFKYYKAEREFKKKLLRDFQEHKDHDKR